MLTDSAELRDLSVEWREERVGWDSALFFLLSAGRISRAPRREHSNREIVT
jgi:hypothetical protein